MCPVILQPTLASLEIYASSIGKLEWWELEPGKIEKLFYVSIKDSKHVIDIHTSHP